MIKIFCYKSLSNHLLEKKRSNLKQYRQIDEWIGMAVKSNGKNRIYLTNSKTFFFIAFEIGLTKLSTIAFRNSFKNELIKKVEQGGVLNQNVRNKIDEEVQKFRLCKKSKDSEINGIIRTFVLNFHKKIDPEEEVSIGSFFFQ